MQVSCVPSQRERASGETPGAPMQQLQNLSSILSRWNFSIISKLTVSDHIQALQNNANKGFLVYSVCAFNQVNCMFNTICTVDVMLLVGDRKTHVTGKKIVENRNRSMLLSFILHTFEV